MTRGLGYVFAILSAVFNGSFVAFAKIKSVAACDLHPFLFNLYVACGVFLSSWLACPFLPLVHADFGFTWFGFVAGALFVCSAALSFAGASILGLSTGQGVWGAVAIVVSFLWGVAGPAPISAPLRSVPLSIVAIVLLLVGVAGIVKCELLAQFVTGLSKQQKRKNEITLTPVEDLPMPTMAVAIVETDASDKVLMNAANDDLAQPNGSSAAGAARRLTGFAAAVGVGIFGGSILAPSAFAGPDFRGSKAINFLPSFGIGSLVTGLLITGGWMGVTVASGGTLPSLHLRATLWAGLMSGLTWNLGNVCSIIAINTFGIPFGIAYPLLQTSLVVGGLLGLPRRHATADTPPPRMEPAAAYKLALCHHA